MKPPNLMVIVTLYKMIAVLLIVEAFGGVVLPVYELWYDWHRHRFEWVHLGCLLIGFCVAGGICYLFYQVNKKQ